MKHYSKECADARDNIANFSAFWCDSQQRQKKRQRDLAQIASEAHQRQVDERRREQTRERVARHRAARKSIWEPRPIDKERLAGEMRALRLWLEADGRPQRKLRKRAREIGLVRVLYTEHLARTGEEPKHREMAEAMGQRTGKDWTGRQGQTALGWINQLEKAEVWKPLPRSRGVIRLSPEIEALLAELED